MRILSVDDDPIILELLTAVLESIGYTDVTTAESATEAFAILKDSNKPFDCFLLDIQMPNIDGIQLCKSIRLMPEYQRAPILMITAMSDKGYIDRAFSAGATDYITKPFDMVELNARVKTVENLIEAWQQQDEKTNDTVLKASHLGTEKPFGIDERLAINDVDGVINYSALENYVSQLSRGMLFGSSVIAFSIADIERIYKNTSAFDFKSLIIDISEAITFCLKRNQFLVSYAGNGTFVCIVEAGDRTPADVLEEELKDIIISMDLCHSDGRSILCTVVIGKSIRLSFRRGQDVISALSQAAKNAQIKSEDMGHGTPERSFLDSFVERMAG